LVNTSSKNDNITLDFPHTQKSHELAGLARILLALVARHLTPGIQTGSIRLRLLERCHHRLVFGAQFVGCLKGFDRAAEVAESGEG